MNEHLDKRKLNFIEKVRKIHKNKYDYELMEYVNAHTKIKIICPIHGVFEQSPDSHIRNHGCPKCNGGVKITQTEFIERSKKTHKNKYNYDLVDYLSSSNKVKIICPIHGVFEQRPTEHIKYGCKKCGFEKIKNSKTLNLLEFIERGKKIHKNKYGYDLVEYHGHRHKIKIICPFHGIFEQKTNSHLNGSGCPYCKESKGEKKIRNFLTEHNIKFIPQKKFKECVYKSKLPFDFYLPTLNLCIEYDGEQHTNLNFFSKNKEILMETKKRDKIKTDFCDNKNGRPKLLRISYEKYNEIDNILINYLLVDDPNKI